MTLGVPSFDSLAHAAAAAPEGYALFEKDKARKYIKERNAFIEHVRKTLDHTDLTDAQKVMAINMHPGKGLR